MSTATRRAGRLAIGLMLLGMLLFVVNDAMGKWLVASYSIGQVILIRSAAALMILAPLLWRAGLSSLVSIERPGIQLFRVVLTTAEVYCFYFAVMYLPLADVMTYWLAAPIYIAALSPLVLGEAVGLRRWAAIAVGFVGVVIALEPSSATLTLPALISLAGSLAFAFIVLTARVLRGTPDVALVFWQMVGAGLVGLLTAPVGWVAPGGSDFMLIALLGIVAMLAHLCVNRALKLSDAAMLAPFQYTQLPWAVLFGWLVFADLPRPAMLAGAAIIVSAGLFIVYRERHLKNAS